MANVSVIGDGASLSITAGDDINLTGAVLTVAGTDSQVVLEAGHDINLKTQALHSKADMTENANNYIRTERGTELGTDITATGDIAMVAGQDIHVRQGYVASDAGSVGMAANRDVIIEHGDTYAKDQYGLKYKSRGLLSSSKTTIRSATESHGVEGTTISGDSVSIAAGSDAKIKASNVVATQDVTIAANHTVDITSADTTRTHDYYEKTTKSGLMGAGLGVMIGTKSVKDTLDGDYLAQAKSNIGSEQGKVSIQAGDTVHVTSSDIVADTGIAISGQDVTLDAKANETHEVQTHEEKSSGLTLSLGGVVGNTINAVSQQVSKAKHRDDKRLTALELLEVGKDIKSDVYEPLMDGRSGNNLLTDAVMKNQIAQHTPSLIPGAKEDLLAKADQTTDKALEKKENQKRFKDNLVQINVSLGSQKSKQFFENNTVEYVGGILASNGTIDIEAKSAADTKGSIKAIAETIKGKAVNLSATKDVSLAAAENTYDSQYTNTSSGWSVGTSISPVSGMSPNVNVGINKAKEDGKTHQTSHTGTKVVGTESVTIQSGQDTNITGSQVQGETVSAKVGKDLTITSLQDVNDYHETSSASGLNLSIGDITKLGAKGANITGGASYSKGKMDSNYASVTEQAGIYAGTGGFHVETQGTTSLTGAVIDSAVDSKEADTTNTLTTGDLVLKDIENKADYKVSSKGIAYNKFEEGAHDSFNEKGLIPVLMPGASDNDSSITRSAIEAGTISVTNQPDFDAEKLNRDTKHSLNQLDEIFDKKKIEERQELARLIAKEAFNQLHYWNPKTKEDKAAKAIAHGIVGEIAARVAGNAPGSGFTATMTNEALTESIIKVAKNNPDVAQWLSAIVGATVNKVAGKDASVGAATAQYGMKWNNMFDNDITEGQFVQYNDALFAMNSQLELEYSASSYNTDQGIGSEFESRYDWLGAEVGSAVSQLTDDYKLAGSLLSAALHDGSNQYFPLESLAANRLNTDPAFRAKVIELGSHIPLGQTEAHYTSIEGSGANWYAFGHIKMAINITHNYDGSYSVNGMAGDVYNYEEHTIQRLGDYINNAAYKLQEVGRIKPYIYYVEISNRIY